MKQIRLGDRTRLAYSLRGVEGGPLVVLCDGISCDGFAWRYLGPWLDRHFRVLHVQYRGHGSSGVPRDPGAVTLPVLARDLDEVMTRLELDGPGIFIGHSMGVQVILEMAWRFPTRVRAGILLCGSGGRVLDTFNNSDLAARLLPRVRVVADRHRAWVGRALRTVMPTELAFLVAGFTEINRELVRREDFMPYLEHFSTMPPDLFARMLEDAAWRTAYPFLPHLRQPMVLIAAERDGFTPARMCRRLADALPECEFHLLAGTTHTAPIEVPERMERLIDGFLTRYALWEEARSCPEAGVSLAARMRAAGARRAGSGRRSASDARSASAAPGVAAVVDQSSSS